MEYTENLGLRKPLPTELYDVGDFNYNADVLDAKFKEHDDLLDEYGDLPDNLSEVEEKADTAMSIAKGRNQAHVFSTTQAMQTWLSVADNKGLYQVGDNLYIVDVGVPDWWISEVLDTADAETGYYYKIAQLETQKADLTEIEAELATLNEELNKKQDASTAITIVNIGEQTVSSAESIRDNTYSFTPTQLVERLIYGVRYLGVYEQEITLAGGGTFFQNIPSDYQSEGYFYMINCTGNSLHFLANMEKFAMAVKNTSSETLTTTVQVYCFGRGLY